MSVDFTPLWQEIKLAFLGKVSPTDLESRLRKYKTLLLSPLEHEPPRSADRNGEPVWWGCVGLTWVCGVYGVFGLMRYGVILMRSRCGCMGGDGVYGLCFRVDEVMG